MKLLEERILQEGIVLGEDILKVDGFINHQVDVELMEALGRDMAEHFRDQGVTKVFTIESSGIAPAIFTAKYLNVPMVILKRMNQRTFRQRYGRQKCFLTQRMFPMNLHWQRTIYRTPITS